MGVRGFPPLVRRELRRTAKWRSRRAAGSAALAVACDELRRRTAERRYRSWFRQHDDHVAD
ncbi:hypothetical protein [Streptomyces sp. NPDC012888]|uniref:hypothetical protein n=1 Tax=Streptomyces sp. NPDC012888 TaxID=3364855 RepID=UPI0036CBDD93